MEGHALFIAFFCFALLIEMGVILYFCQTHAFQATLIKSSKICYTYLLLHPLYVFIAMVFLPTFGIPITPFFIIAGSVFGMRWGLTFCLFGIGASLIFSYYFYRYCLNKTLFQLIFHKTPTIKTSTLLGSFRWVLLIQLIPGLPYAVQNYILSIVEGVNFWHYLSVSWIAQLVWAYGFVCGGDNWIQGHWGVGAILFLCLTSWLTHRAYKYFQRHKYFDAKTLH